MEKSVDIETVRDLLGHSSIIITQRYTHSNDDRKRKAVELLSCDVCVTHGRIKQQGAPVAQWIEQWTSNPKVGGSNPSGRARFLFYAYVYLIVSNPILVIRSAVLFQPREARALGDLGF